MWKPATFMLVGLLDQIGQTVMSVVVVAEVEVKGTKVKGTKVKETKVKETKVKVKETNRIPPIVIKPSSINKVSVLYTA